MTSRTTAPLGAPCWADLWTSDVEGSRRFYGELLGWEAQAPSPEFHGYFMWTRDGQPVAGGMGAVGGAEPANLWTVYLATDDVAKAVGIAEGEGGRVLTPPMQVADLGTEAVLEDPTGARIGLWQPETFHGFTTLNEHGSPSWFELQTHDHDAAVAFYRAVLRCDLVREQGQEAFAYTSLLGSGEAAVAGIMDASNFLPEGAPSRWSLYWEVDDVAATLADARRLGGTVLMDAMETPYGCLGGATDPAGATFALRTTR